MYKRLEAEIKEYFDEIDNLKDLEIASDDLVDEIYEIYIARKNKLFIDYKSKMQEGMVKDGVNTEK